VLFRSRLDGQIAAERFRVKGLRLASLKVPMQAQDGVLDVGPVDAKLYDGALKAHLRVDVQGDRPVTTLTCTLAGVQQKPLFSDLAGKESQFAGVMHVDTVSPLVAQGNSEQAMRHSLNGRVRFSVKDGVFPGVNLTAHVSDALAKVKKLLTAGIADGPERSTRFGSLEGTAAIVGGVASIDDLDCKAPLLRASGKGTIDLATKQVRYELTAKLAATTEGQGGVAAQDAWGIPVVVPVSGPYDNPEFGNPLVGLGRGAIEAAGRVVKGIGKALTGGGKKPAGGEGKKPGVLDNFKIF
jgi:AsmA protein